MFQVRKARNPRPSRERFKTYPIGAVKKRRSAKGDFE